MNMDVIIFLIGFLALITIVIFAVPYVNEREETMIECKEQNKDLYYCCVETGASPIYCLKTYA